MMHSQRNGFSVSLPTFIALISISLPFVAHSNSPVIFNFGDSNSDTGGLVSGIGLQTGYPYGRSFFRRPMGRATDGRLLIDFFCEHLDTHYLSPYLDSLGPNFTNGANFAIGGAATLPRNALFNLGIQLGQFNHFYNRSTELSFKGCFWIEGFDLEIGFGGGFQMPPIMSRLKSTTLTQKITRNEGARNLVGEEDFKNALYTFDIGQNDLTDSCRSLSYAQVIERIPSFISEIRDAIWAIYRLGGKNFWVHNTGPYGCLPKEIALRSIANNGSDFDQYGCIKSFNEAAKAFNTQLNALCEELRYQMENSTIVYVDVYSIKYDLIANSSSYGFENPLMACCGFGGAPYNYDPDRTCITSAYTVCDEGTRSINWDGIHYSEAANAIVASKILSTLYSSPPLGFNFFCNNDYRVSST